MGKEKEQARDAERLMAARSHPLPGPDVRGRGGGEYVRFTRNFTSGNISYRYTQSHALHSDISLGNCHHFSVHRSLKAQHSQCSEFCESLHRCSALVLFPVSGNNWNPVQARVIKKNGQPEWLEWRDRAIVRNNAEVTLSLFNFFFCRIYFLVSLP